MNVTLIGMAGAGKSYIGKRLARQLRFEFLDIDEVLERMHGKALEKILEELGDELFLQTESKAIIDSTAGKDKHVFSPGGSAIYESEAMQHLDSISHIVFLRVPLETLDKRIGNSPSRMGRVVGLRNKSFKVLLEERTVLYEKYAHNIVDIENLSVQESVDAIMIFLKRTQ